MVTLRAREVTQIQSFTSEDFLLFFFPKVLMTTTSIYSHATFFFFSKENLASCLSTVNSGRRMELNEKGTRSERRQMAAVAAEMIALGNRIFTALKRTAERVVVELREGRKLTLT